MPPPYQGHVGWGPLENLGITQNEVAENGSVVFIPADDGEVRQRRKVAVRKRIQAINQIVHDVLEPLLFQDGVVLVVLVAMNGLLRNKTAYRLLEFRVAVERNAANHLPRYVDEEFFPLRKEEGQGIEHMSHGRIAPVPVALESRAPIDLRDPACDFRHLLVRKRECRSRAAYCYGAW